MAAHARNHVIPKAHVALFARNGLVICRFAGGTQKRLHPSAVGVRRDFYVVKQDGVRDAAFERAMSLIEGKAASLLRDIARRWPLDEDDSALLAEYLALQVVRSSAFRAWHQDTSRALLKKGAAKTDALIGEAGLRRLSEDLLSSRGWQDSMSRLISRMATLFGSMHWSLVRFSSPGLVLSDQPVVAVPLSTGYTGPVVGMSGGVVDLIELRLPIDPSYLLLCTWIDAPDDTPIITGRRQWLAGLNAATIAQADEHWFHRPGATPPHVADVINPLSWPLFGQEAVDGARGGPRHGAAWAALREIVADEHEIRFMRLVRVGKGPARAA